VSRTRTAAEAAPGDLRRLARTDGVPRLRAAQRHSRRRLAWDSGAELARERRRRTSASSSPTTNSAIWETSTVSVRETVRCPGCQREVAVARPEGVNYEIVRGLTPDGREEITMTIGHVIVHRCMLFPDGEWR
jgi:hypothetical protein